MGQGKPPSRFHPKTPAGQCARLAGSAACVLGAVAYTPDASACGGLFCATRPVDQTAERVLFEVDDASVTMTVQIAFSGNAEDFAWVLPLSEPPDPTSLQVFSQAVLNWLDTNSGPTFPGACPYTLLGPTCEQCAQAGRGDGRVQVLLRAEVGAYDASVIGSDDADALVQWLHDAGYRITPAMEPYLAQYAAEGMKFLALKLQESAGVQDIRPFRFTVPGTSPNIPLRMTALAAEPEMSIVTFILAAQRYEGKNWPQLEISDDPLRYDPYVGFPPQTNWSALVAHAVDAAGGQGWVTESAGPSAPYADLLLPQLMQTSTFPTPEDVSAGQQLLAALHRYPYLTRLYTRLSAEEMTSDPVFGRSALGDVSRLHTLSRVVAGVDQCTEAVYATDPCEFTNCGASGLCRAVLAAPPASSAVRFSPAGCACLPGATARTTLAAYGRPSVTCQDGRFSFMNPGDRETPDVDALPDPCAGFDCGRGQCVSMNLSPSCVCDQGYVAVGSVDAQGVRGTRCVKPDTSIPSSFYEERLASLPDGIHPGREVNVPDPLPSLDLDAASPPGAFPMPRVSDRAYSDSGCTLTRRAGETNHARWLVLALALSKSRRKKIRRRRPA